MHRLTRLEKVETLLTCLRIFCLIAFCVNKLIIILAINYLERLGIFFKILSVFLIAIEVGKIN